MTNPIEKIKEIEEEIKKWKGKLPKFYGDYTQGECLANIIEDNLFLEYMMWQILEAKLKVYKEWEQREKEILEILKNADYGSYMITEGNAGAVFDINNFIKKEIKPKIKGEK